MIAARAKPKDVVDEDAHRVIGHLRSFSARSRPRGRARHGRPPEDPAVALVEEILEAAAAQHPAAHRVGEGTPVAAHALWICACVSQNDAPKWLVYGAADGGLARRRVPDRVEALSLVDAQLSAGVTLSPAPS